VRDLIFQLREEGRTVLFSTHILSDVEAVCDRVAILVGGRMTDSGSLSELLSPGVRAVELVANGVPPPLVQELVQGGAKALQRDHSVVLTFATEEAAQRALKRVLEAGGAAVSLQPHRQTLEELFVRRAGASAA
jgi:ABC-2 type transport system ATP-binding protein